MKDPSIFLATDIEAELSVDYLAAIVGAVGHPIFVKDRARRHVLFNRAFSDMVGFAPVDMLGRTDNDFLAPEEAAFFRSVDERVFSDGETVSVEEPVTDANGVRHVLATTKMPLRNEAGEVTHLVAIIHDITRLKAAEDALRFANEDLERRVRERTHALQAAQSELVRTERLAVLGQLAGGLAHQIRNPLGAITNAAYVVQRALARTPSTDASRALAIILEEVWQANRIITDLLDCARVRMPDRRPVDVAVLVDQAIAMREIPRSVVVTRDLAGLPRLSVDPDQVRDALSNLICNAVEAMDCGGRLRVAGSFQDGEVSLTIADTGPGISREVADHLFEPLVTTKPRGLGLGLTMARALIQNQGGTIDCSTSKEGTRFTVRLPIENG